MSYVHIYRGTKSYLTINKRNEPPRNWPGPYHPSTTSTSNPAFNMKYTSTVFTLLAAAAAGVQAANIQLVGKVMNSAAKEGFENSRTLVYAGGKTKRDAPKVYEPDLNRDYSLEDGYIFVLQCSTVGFRPECISFGSEPGKCVSYFDFDPKKGDHPTSISDAFNHNVTSISTNTGGVCQFYHYTGCDDKGDDRGLSSSYNYNLNVSLPEDPRTVQYFRNVTSWRC